MKHRLLVLMLTMLSVIQAPAIPAQDSDAQARAQAAAKATASNFHFFYVPSSGLIADQTFITVSRTKGPSAMAKQLAKGIRGSDTEPLFVAVSGPSSEKTVQVIQDALKSTNKKSLPMLTLIFVGGDDAAKTLEADVKGIQAAFVYVRYP
jgi:hypothetical protein